MSDAEVKAEFRFAPYDIELLSQALRIPEKFTCLNGTVASGEEGLLMLLERFAYPCRLRDMVPRFDRSLGSRNKPDFSRSNRPCCQYSRLPSSRSQSALVATESP